MTTDNIIETQEFCIFEDLSDRIDVYLTDVIELSRSHIAKLIQSGCILLNGIPVTKASKTVKQGDKIIANIPKPVPIDLKPQNIPLDIVYEDEYLVVLNKQQGLTVHPAGGSYTDTLVNALLYHVKDLSGINGDIRPGIVHRLDKDTSGLMVVAKNDFAHLSLAKQIATKECRRIYYALVEGIVKEDSGIVDQPIGHSRVDYKKMIIDCSGRSAVTLYNVVERYSNNTLVRFELKTGRTHQIRVHAAFLNHPVVGDKTYGYKKQRFALNGQLLHSKIIEFSHPKTNERLCFESELPDYFLKILSSLKKSN